MINRLLNLVAILCFSYVAHAQIVIKSGDFEVDDTPQNRVQYYGQGLDSPMSGVNMLWDYSDSNFYDGTSANLIYNTDATNRFPGSQFISTATSFIFGLPLTSNYHYGYSSTGFGRLGFSFPETKFPLSGVTGNPNDTLYFLEQFQRAELPILPVNFEYGTRYSNNYTYADSMLLTYSAAGFNKTPLQRVTDVNYNIEAIGEGTIIVPFSAEGGKSDSIPTLLIRRESVSNTTYMLDGSPAPDILLTQFGRKQNERDSGLVYYFYREGEFTAVLFISPEPETNQTLYVLHTDRVDSAAASIAEIPSIGQVKLYPQPATSSFTLQAAKAVKPVLLYDASGRVAHTFSAIRSENGRYALPSLQPGIYMLQVADAQGHTGHMRLLVK